MSMMMYVPVLPTPALQCTHAFPGLCSISCTAACGTKCDCDHHRWVNMSRLHVRGTQCAILHAPAALFAAGMLASRTALTACISSCIDCVSSGAP